MGREIVSEEEILSACERVIHAHAQYVQTKIAAMQKIHDDELRDVGMSILQAEHNYLVELQRLVHYWRTAGALLDAPERVADKPMVTDAQIAALKALGYLVIDANDNEHGAQVRGPNWETQRVVNGFRYHIGASWIAADAWFKALEHARGAGLVK